MVRPPDSITPTRRTCDTLEPPPNPASDIMDAWAASLGVHCDSCHAADPAHPRPDGRPGLNFVDDSKPEKNTARKMFKMMEEINMNYIMKIDNSGDPVTCGTCHRGHFGPQPFVIPKEEHHMAPPPGAPPAQK